MVLGYIGTAVGMTLLETFIKINDGTSLFIVVMMSTFLAIPAHIAILIRLDADQVSVWLNSQNGERCCLRSLPTMIKPLPLPENAARRWLVMLFHDCLSRSA